MIANEPPHDKNLQKEGIFGLLEDGEPEIFEKDFNKIKGLNDNRIKYFNRKEEVQEILCFLKDTQKILLVCGPSGTSRVQTIAKAIRYSFEHDFEACRDGAYYIDLNEAK